MVHLKMNNDNVGASYLAADHRVLQEAERMHRTEGGMSVIHMQIPPELSVRMAEMAGREGRMKEEQRRRETEERGKALQAHRNKCFDELEEYYSQRCISSATNTETLTKLARQLKQIKQIRQDPTRPPPEYHWDKVTTNIPVSNTDVEVRFAKR
jgi:hypothetical protein